MKKKLLITLIALCTILFAFGAISVFAAENTTEFFGGDGTENNPYIIGKKEHLNNVRNYLDACFELVVDLAFEEADFADGGDFYNQGEGWKPIGTEEIPFSGVFNGNNHTISGLKIDVSVTQSVTGGLFAYNDGTINDLNITESRFDMESSVRDTIVYAGGIAGYNTGDIINCEYSSYIHGGVIYWNIGGTPLDGKVFVGGIAGFNTGNVLECINNATIQTSVSGNYDYSGGIAGYNEGNIKNCDNSGELLYSGYYGGGIAGYNSGSIENSNNLNIVDASANSPYTGGIVGDNSGKILGCKNVGYVYGDLLDSSSIVYTGGIAGINNSQIENCENSGHVSIISRGSGGGSVRKHYMHVGGIVGINKSTIKLCKQTGEVQSTPKYTNTNYKQQRIDVYSYTGGIAGTNDGEIFCCYNSNLIRILKNTDNGYICGDGYGWAGGIAGINNSKISNCFNLGEIMSDSSKTAYLGGISGQNISKIDCCYTMNRYPISACSSSKIGYALGETTNNITDTYYLYDNEDDADEYGVPCTIEQLCDKNTFKSFDFANVWNFDDDISLPTLMNAPFIAIENTNDFAGGTGYAFYPYLIENSEQFSNIRKFPYANYKITKDIVFKESDFTSSGKFYNNGDFWIPFEEFGGVLNGSGCAISGLKTTIGCIWKVNDGSIKDLHIKSCTFDKKYFGTITAINHGIISDVTTYCDIKINATEYSDYAGGVVGTNEGEITNCINNIGNFNNTHYGGYIGGIVGENTGKVSNCKNNADITSTYKNGSERVVGGVVGTSSKGIIENCVNFGDISTYDASGGGIVGPAGETELNYCYNIGDILVNFFVGEESYSSVKAGGITSSSGRISNSYNTGNVNCDTSWRSSYVGGISGYSSVIKNCYSMGKVSSSKPKGYLQKAYVGAIVGSSDVENTCYFLDNCDVGTGNGTDDAKKCTLQEMSLKETFSTFDFDTIWFTDSLRGYAYPMLRNNSEFSALSIELVGDVITPIKTKINQAPDVSHLTIEITYADGEVLSITADKTMINPENYSSIGEYNIPLEYCGVKSSQTIPIVVLDKEAIGIEVSKLPNKTQYIVGEDFDTDGIEVVLVYDNGEKVPIEYDSISGYDSSVGKKTMVVIYGDKSTNFEVEVSECISISLTSKPNKLTYVQGQPINPQGGIIKATLSNGKTLVYDLSIAQVTYPIDSIGTVVATVKAFDKTTTFNITTTERIITNMSIHTEPDKIIYFIGDAFDATGGLLKIDFESEDGYYELIPIEANMISGFDSSVVGYPTLSIQYKGFQNSLLIRVRKFDSSLAQLSLNQEGNDIVVSYENIPDSAIVYVAQYDSIGRMLTVHTAYDRMKIKAETDMHQTCAFLWNKNNISPYGEKITLK